MEHLCDWLGLVAHEAHEARCQERAKGFILCLHLVQSADEFLLVAMLAAASLVRASHVFDNLVHSTAAVRDNLRSLFGALCKAYVIVAGNKDFAVPG